MLLGTAVHGGVIVEAREQCRSLPQAKIGLDTYEVVLFSHPGIPEDDLFIFTPEGQ
jgi:hypothetical protein